MDADANAANHNAASREDAQRLLSLAAQTAIRAKSAFPMLEMHRALVEEETAVIDDVTVVWRLTPLCGFAIEIGVMLQGATTVTRVLFSSLVWASFVEPLGGHPAGAVVGDAAAAAVPPAPLETLLTPMAVRGYILQCVLGQSCLDIATLESRIAKPPIDVMRVGLPERLKRLVQFSVCGAALTASARIRRVSVLEHLRSLVVQQEERRSHPWHFPKPICMLQPQDAVFVVPDTATVCRTFASAVQCMSAVLERVCQRTMISEELHVQGGYPAFHTSAEEEYHAVSTLVGPLAEEAAYTGCVVGLTYSPITATDAANAKKAKKGFVSAPPPPVPYEKYQTLFRTAQEHAAAPSALTQRSAQLPCASTYVRVASPAEVEASLQQPEGPSPPFVPLIDPTEHTITELMRVLCAMRTQGVAFGLDLSGAHCHAACVGDGDELLPSLAVACGASCVLLPPPRGSQHTAMYNIFLRIEEALIRRHGSCYLAA